MGVRISRSGLVSAVANAGCVGTIASVGLGDFEYASGKEYVSISNAAIREEIRKTRTKTSRPFAINILGALSNYNELVKICVQERVAFIATGSRLPLDLPSYDPENRVGLIPIVSSVRALALIVRKWQKKYNRLPDAVIVEGPLAGGHLGYSREQLKQNDPDMLLEKFREVREYLTDLNLKIPLVVGGGIFDGKQAKRYLNSGADGVQMATRFVCTEECDAHINFKKEYLRAEEKDVVIIDSPVGLPGRVISNPFVQRMLAGERIPFHCNYKCLKTCNPAQSPYCIARLLAEAAAGNFENAFAFAGQNVHRCDKIVTVPEVIQAVEAEMKDAR